MRIRNKNTDFDVPFKMKGTMCNVGAAMIGAAVVGGVASYAGSTSAAKTQSDAASSAAQAQLQATNNANQLQYTMYQQNMANQSPYLQGGQMGMSALESAMFGQYNPGGAATSGTPIGGNATIQPVTGQPNMHTQNISNGGDGMATPGGGSGGVPSNGVQYSTDAHGNLVSTGGVATGNTGGGTGINAPTTGTSSPYQQAGVQNYGASQGQLNTAANATQGMLNHNFDASDLKTQLAPNYQFQLGQGEQALKASMAATGQLQTGQGMKNINDYAQNQASGAYQNAFNNYTTQQNNLYTRLQGLIAPGANAASSAGQAGTAAGSGIAGTTMAGTSAANNYNTSAAAANAAGTVGATNAVTGAINSGITGYMNGQNYSNNQQIPGFNGTQATGGYTYQNPSTVGPQLPTEG